MTLPRSKLQQINLWPKIFSFTLSISVPFCVMRAITLAWVSRSGWIRSSLGYRIHLLSQSA